MLMQESEFTSYQQVDLDAQAASANPYQLVLMLIDGLMDELTKVKGHIKEKRFAEKGEAINKCMNILIGLDSALDLENGGDIAKYLHDLYSFCQMELFRASAHNDLARIDTVTEVMTNIRDGWEGFGQHA